MQPSSDSDEASTKQQTPKVMYDTGHDNKVFVGEGLPKPQFTQPQSHGTANAYYPNGHGTVNVNGHGHGNGNAPHLRANHTNEEMQPTYRVIENSRL